MTSAKTITITATKLRRDMGPVLDAVLAGTTIHVTRNGRPLCSLVPPKNNDAFTAHEGDPE
jgi:prevent-host-death family protein